MAINDEGDGVNKFDPKHRIRDVLGDEFVDNTEAEALARLSQASKSAVVNNKPLPEEAMGPKEWISKIQHSSDMKPKQDKYIDPNKLSENEINERITTGIKAAKAEWSKFTAKRNPFNVATNLVLGVGTNQTKSENINGLIRTTLRTVSSSVVNDLVETTAKLGNTKNFLTAAGVSIAIDGITSYALGTNGATIEKFVDENNVTKADFDTAANAVSRVRNNYAIQHAVATVMLPAALKFGVDKFINKDKQNTALGAALSFGTFSTLSRGALSMIRYINGKKLEHEADCLPETAESAEFYDKTITAVAYNSNSRQMDPGILGGIAGSVVGYRSVSFENVTKDTDLNKVKTVLVTKDKNKGGK